jgi:hypothetical protein
MRPFVLILGLLLLTACVDERRILIEQNYRAHLADCRKYVKEMWAKYTPLELTRMNYDEGASCMKDARDAKQEALNIVNGPVVYPLFVITH